MISLSGTDDVRTVMRFVLPNLKTSLTQKRGWKLKSIILLTFVRPNDHSFYLFKKVKKIY